MFELRFGAASHPDANRRRLLEDALDRLLDQLIQERVAPSMAMPLRGRRCWPLSARLEGALWICATRWWGT